MTELQKCEFDIMLEIINICERFDISYYFVCGSALGAVKYNGFIPWDDDIDIGIFRKDYDKFLSVAAKHLPKYLFVQNYHTDREFFQIYTKIRNCKTTFIEKSVSKLNINHGVYVDIFPLDGYPKETREKKVFDIKKKIYRFFSDSCFDFPRSMKAEIAVNLLRAVGIKKWLPYILKRYERLISSYDTEETDIICNHGNWQGKLEYAPKEQYGQGIMMKFEGIDVRVPEKYDEYLTQKYGDWRAELPEKDRCGHHYYSIMDLCNPYTKYVNR